MSFVAYCFICEKKVTAHTLLDAASLLSALSNDDNIEVMHTSENGDHCCDRRRTLLREMS